MFAAPGAYLAIGLTNAWRLVGDVVHGGLGTPLSSGFYVQDYKPGVPGWQVTVEKTYSNPGSVANAETYLHQAGSYQSWSAYEIAPFINYMQTGTQGNFSSLAASPFNVPDRPIPGMTINRNVDGFVVLAQGTVYIPAAGNWTFGANTDDGWEVDLTSAAGFTYHNENAAVSNPSLFTVSFPTAGDYSCRFLYHEGSAGSEGEFFAAQGSYSSLASTSTWALVGDTAHGGLQVTAPDGFDVTLYKSTGAVGNLTSTNNTGVAGVINAVANQSWTRREIDPYINFNNNEAGHFQTGQPLNPNQNVADEAPPGLDVQGGPNNQDIDNYVIQAKGTMYIPAAGQYTFGVNSDEGFSFQITSPNRNSPAASFTAAYGDVGYTAIASTTTLNDTLQSNHARTAINSLGVASFTQPGYYQVRLLYWEGTGGSEVELYCAPGSKTAFDSSFTLLGDRAHGGLVVSKPIGWDVATYKTAGNPSGIADAEARIWDPTSYATLNNTFGPRYEIAPYINYEQTGTTTSGSTTSNVTGDFQNAFLDNCAGLATATVTIPATSNGLYTFGVSNDGGFRLTITPVGASPAVTFSAVTGGGGAGTNVMYYNANRAVGDTFGNVTFPTAGGTYTLRLEWYHNTGGSEVELYARQATDTAFNAGSRLVGDSAGGGLAIASLWAVTLYRANVTINTLTLADTLLVTPSQQVWNQTDSPSYINYYLSGTDGHYTTPSAGVLGPNAPATNMNRAFPHRSTSPSGTSPAARSARTSMGL